MNIRRLIQQSHLKRLPAGKSCLIADTDELTLDMNDRVLSTQSLVYTSLPTGKSHGWIWHFDTKGTYKDGVQTWFNVLARHI